MNEEHEVYSVNDIMFDDYDNYDTADILPNGYDVNDVYDFYEERLITNKEEK